MKRSSVGIQKEPTIMIIPMCSDPKKLDFLFRVT